MFNFKVNIFLLVLSFWLTMANAVCPINIMGGTPVFTKKFGQKILALPDVGGRLDLQIGEKVNAYCSTGFSLRTDYRGYIREAEAIRQISIECSGTNNMKYQILDPPRYPLLDLSSEIADLKCVQGATTLFESKNSLEGCENYTSLGIGTKLDGMNQIVIAATCFDTDTLTTKFVKYLSHGFKYELRTSYPSNIQITSLNTPMESLEVFFKDLNTVIFKNRFHVKQMANPLLNAHEYEFLNIIQDIQIKADMQQFSYLLNTVWWRNFRLGSWNLFLSALKKRSNDVKYIVYIGTSGKLTIPTATNCNQDEEFNIDGTFNVPEIIWAYIKPQKSNKINKHDEFVVFGYNTPFYKADNETIICEDICNEIDWLHNDNFNKIRLLPAFGIMHCCRPQDVASQLDIFPLKPKLSISSTTELPAYRPPKFDLESYGLDD